MIAPRERLFAPIEGWATWAPWLTFVGLVAAAAGAWWLFENLRRSRLALGQTNAALVDRNAQIQEAATAQRRFISAASHELRTPLTSIIGYLDLALEAEGREDREHALGVVRRNSERLYGLVDSLMLIFRSEVETFAQDEVDLHGVFAHAVEASIPNANEKGIQLGLAGKASVIVLGDKERLGQVADNLISNAIKYSLEGGRVNVVVGFNDTRATASVSDQGIGISPDDLGRMFERFFRARTAREARIGGTGLGLAIIRTIIEKHGGRIDISSVEGEGTTFTIELPLAEGES